MRWLTAGIFSLLLILTGCGGDDDEGASDGSGATTSTAAPATNAPGPAPTGYGDETESAFLEACTSGAGEDLTDVCHCIYDRTEAEVPFEEFQAFDDALAADPTADLPAALVDVYTDCVLAEAPDEAPPTSAA